VWVGDLETVVDAVGLERFALLGVSQGAAIAVAYAARHPDRVRDLVLYGGYARGRRFRGQDEEEDAIVGATRGVTRVAAPSTIPADSRAFLKRIMSCALSYEQVVTASCGGRRSLKILSVRQGRTRLTRGCPWLLLSNCLPTAFFTARTLRHRQADEAEATGGTRSSSMWAMYASETTVYRNWPAGPSPTGELTRTTSSMFSGRKNATPCSR
jgi:pimeloyl-ACP methyl ester carboxylesterase